MRAPRIRILSVLTALAAAWYGSSALGRQAGTDGQVEARPLAPDEALASFELEPGYRIELAAAEPLITSPLAMAFDEQGRLYVVENRGYPGPLEGAGRPAPEGTIALLEDNNGDGRFDTRRDFAANLTDPNGIMPWDGGVFVSAAPHLWYLKDTTGDGVADERRVVLTGFDATRTPQIRFSHPTLGIDNRVYLTSGLIGGSVTAPDHPERPPITFATSDSRFDPFTHEFELTGGQGQYGLTFDDYGRRFICANRHPVWQVVLERRHLQRNPHLAFSETVQEVSAVGSNAVVWPISADMTTASFHPSLIGTPHAGTFTAASGVHIHRGDALPDGHRDSIFICESAQNLVQRQVRSPNGVSFVSRPARTGREFLASRDQWFRPVFAANGPDGALYIVDMYRKFIDHPQYVPEQSRALLDFEAGKQRGRIYRIVARDWKRNRKRIDLGRMTPAELAATLEHPNAWWRETAQRLLVERRDRSAVPFVREIAERGRSGVARIHALWTLDGLGSVESADVAPALRDPQAAVRENAARIAESRLAAPDLLREVLRLAADPDDRVRLQAALALGETTDPRAVDALASIARRDGAERWMRAAVLSSVRDRSSEFLRAFVEGPDLPRGGAAARVSAKRVPLSQTVRAAVMQDLAQVFGAGQTPERCVELIRRIAAPGAEFGWQPAALAGLAQGLQARGFGRNDRPALVTLLSADAPEARAAKDAVDVILERAAVLATDERAPAELRLGAIALMGHARSTSGRDTLDGLVTPQRPSEIQVAAVRALMQFPDRAAAADLLAPRRWMAFTPRVREAVLSALMTDERLTAVLLDALEQGSVPAIALGSSRRGRLVNHRNAAIQMRARTLLAAIDSGDRMQVYQRLRSIVLSRTANADRGQRAFATHCAACHAFDGTRGILGPDLSGIRNQPADAILLHLLVPDYEITPGYQAYMVETRDGRTLVGRLESEAPNSVTIRDAASQQHVILRSQVVSMSASTRSLMPSDLERSMSDQDLSDLIGYLKARPRSVHRIAPR
jgi:putative membrane-bound dehydrogenase-like protein